MARITGLGGLFFKAKDPKALLAWYRDVLGLATQDWGGVQFNAGGGAPPFSVWSAFADTTDYMKPSTKPFMFNFAVDDLDGFLAQLGAKDVEILGRDDSDPNGGFAWILDPEGNKIELWQPAS
ncbi:MAG TPA: VOC family protein [Rhizomicrobium sp.]|jgi:catechol 2,3-dioxygenase-like lactoylglutathione lyase family enzyme|nr:VOC family protein [Rhizomicrobium sp.]